MNRVISLAAVILIFSANPVKGVAEEALTMRRDVYEEALVKGVKLYRSEDYDKAFDLVGRTAVQGDKNSQYLIGLMYLKGQGVKRHTLRGLAWMQTANEADIKDWARDYNKLIAKLDKAQTARVDELAAEYIRLYGMKAQEVTCKKRDMPGSYRKQYSCRKEAGWVLRGGWELPSMREFEEYHVGN